MMPLLNSTTSDSSVACAECYALTHESEDCPHRKQREANIANRAKHFQAKVDKLVREGLGSQIQSPKAQPTSEAGQPTSVPKAAHDGRETTNQMQPPSSSMTNEEKVCLSNVVEQYRLELLRQAAPNKENIHLSLCGGMSCSVETRAIDAEGSGRVTAAATSV